MKRYLLKRISQMAVVFLLVSMFAFAIIYFAPGDPLYMYTSPGKSSFKMSEEQLDLLREDLGLTGNVVHQYVRWAGKTLTGDWGISLNNFLPVRPQILERLPGTIGLMAASLVLSVVLAVPLGLAAGTHKNRWIDNIISGFSYVGISIPSFWFALLLIIVFSLRLGLFPSSGMRSVGVDSVVDVIWHGVLPATVLAVNNMAVFVRYMRSNTINQLEEEYVLTAASKGASKWRILKSHVLKNCLLPIITIVGMNFGTLITGSFIVESVLGWPGLGTLCMSAINNRDYPMIMGIIMLSCTILLIGNFLADMLYGLADPRIKQGNEVRHV
ncbi:peptide ABC transporter permease [Lachnospiraceae bacterium]|uniref:ABC transporter permease n=1 Tax=Extibacter sp. GGCC_0201 TaxID=2731209 RepID=UPI001AA0BCA5|nr:ABC transporter permease [Extibacter sp. GGCC_0201]MBO1721076.1 ABC transporter permease [Extibacter sp. GGCC_0201]BDF35484.1 peptide ABC transporter permease [Lachnospiraceae bacterium]BDF39486.1 peptide ABC transporter permease [Lachnospiraceae bacterium]